jgi:hypothetical protein
MTASRAAGIYGLMGDNRKKIGRRGRGRESEGATPENFPPGSARFDLFNATASSTEVLSQFHCRNVLKSPSTIAGLLSGSCLYLPTC